MRSNSFLEVNLSHLADNFKLLKSKIANSEILFMVKANAYGHGMSKIAEFAYEEFAVSSFGVASLGEAIALRTRLPEVEIYIFSDIDITNAAYQADLKLIPVIAKISDLEKYLDSGLCNPLALMVNTGMNRLGFSYEFDENLINFLVDNKLSVFHLMTHFSDSYLPKKEKTKIQYERFLEIKKKFNSANIKVAKTSVANSGAIENGIGLNETMVRPGLMLYGPQSTLGTKCWDGKIISSLKAEVLQLQCLKKGDTVGYGSTVLSEDGVVAICSLGYGDGLLNSYQKLEVEFKGSSGKFIGRVNMDMFQALFKKDAPKVGDHIHIWESGNDNSLQKVSMHTKMIPYEVFCSISSRVPRRYI